MEESNGKVTVTSNGDGNAPENVTVYRKTDGDDILFAGVKKNIGSNKKSAKKQKVWKFWIFNDFFVINITFNVLG